MVLEALAGFIPLTIPGILWLLIKTFVIFIALVLADKIIAHEMEVKHVLIMAFLCAFVVPIATSIVVPLLGGFIPAMFGQLFYYGLPLLFWIIFGEILLGGEFKEKLVVAFIAFAIFTVLDFIGLQGIIMGLVPV